MAIIIDPTTLISGGDTGTAFAAPISLDTTLKTITITPGSGILATAADGVTGQALYSALKLLWKNNATYIKFPFPMEAITPEEFEFINGWQLANNITRKSLRTCGFVERDASGVIVRTYAGIVSLGSLGATDQPYYQQVSTTGAPVNFSFQGPVNEPVSVKVVADITAANVNATSDTFTLLNNGLVNGDYVKYTQGGIALTGLTNNSYYYVVNAVEATGVFQVSATLGGSPILWTETATGTTTFTKDSTTYMKLFAREYQKTYSAAQLSDIGVSVMTYIVYRFPLANADDSIKVTASGTGGNYNLVQISYLRDTVNNAGAFFNVRGAYSTGAVAYALSDVVMATNNRWYQCKLAYTSNATQPSANVTNWSAFIGERTLDGGATYYPYTVIIDGDNTVVATASGINTTTKLYERIQYQLRQNVDIDDGTYGSGVMIGKTADSLLKFVGDTLVTSTGVFIESVNANDKNSIDFYDGIITKRTYPYTAGGEFNFNPNLVSDASSIYRMYFTQLQGAAVKFGASGAVLVKDDSLADLSGTVSGATVGWSFAYDGNTQTETQWKATTAYAIGDEYKNGTTWYRVATGYTSLGTFGATDTTNSTVLNGSTDGPSATVVAIGLNTGQYVSATTKLLRATGQKIGLVAALERNYTNP
jgi:hypothetical protein